MAYILHRHLLAAPDQGVAKLMWNEFDWPSPGNFHVHETLQVLVMLEGASNIIWQHVGRSDPWQTGQVLLVPPRLVHAVHVGLPPARGMFLDLHIELTHDNEMTRAWRKLAGPALMTGQQAVIRQVGELVTTGAAMAGPAGEAAAASAAWMLLAMLTDDARPGRARQVDHRLLAAERFLHDHLMDPIGVQDIASACRLSVSQLNRLYRRAHRTSPAQRLTRLRIDKARGLLPASLLTVKEIARQCGFVCPNHFCRVFKQVTGQTPGSYRTPGISPGMPSGISPGVPPGRP